MTVLPSVKAVKMHIITSCSSFCSNSEEKPTCPKEKCFLNVNFNVGQFVLFENPDYVGHYFADEILKPHLHGQSLFIDYFKNSIWQPPEATV